MLAKHNSWFEVANHPLSSYHSLPAERKRQQLRRRLNVLIAAFNCRWFFCYIYSRFTQFFFVRCYFFKIIWAPDNFQRLTETSLKSIRKSNPSARTHDVFICRVCIIFAFLTFALPPFCPVPLILEERIRWISIARIRWISHLVRWYQIIHAESFVASLHPFESGLLHCSVHQWIHFQPFHVRHGSLVPCMR